MGQLNESSPLVRLGPHPFSSRSRPQHTGLLLTPVGPGAKAIVPDVCLIVSANVPSLDLGRGGGSWKPWSLLHQEVDEGRPGGEEGLSDASPLQQLDA